MKSVSYVMSVMIVVLSVFSLSSCRTFDGYYYTLSDARNEEKFYNNTDHLFSVELGNTIIDFVIEDQKLHVVEIDSKNVETNAIYQIKGSSSFLLEEHIFTFNQMPDYHWTNSTKLSSCIYSWCIVSEEFNRENENSRSFEFNYKGESYCLCYKYSIRQ